MAEQGRGDNGGCGGSREEGGGVLHRRRRLGRGDVAWAEISTRSGGRWKHLRRPAVPGAEGLSGDQPFPQPEAPHPVAAATAAGRCGRRPRGGRRRRCAAAAVGNDDDSAAAATTTSDTFALGSAQWAPQRRARCTRQVCRQQREGQWTSAAVAAAVSAPAHQSSSAAPRPSRQSHRRLCRPLLLHATATKAPFLHHHRRRRRRRPVSHKSTASAATPYRPRSSTPSPGSLRSRAPPPSHTHTQSSPTSLPRRPTSPQPQGAGERSGTCCG